MVDADAFIEAEGQRIADRIIAAIPQTEAADKAHGFAIQALDALMAVEPTEPAPVAFFDALADAIEAYETARWPIGEERPSDVRTLADMSENAGRKTDGNG